MIGAVYRAQADALEIEAEAKRRLADEYDAAQERGEVRTRADNQLIPGENKLAAFQLGLTSKDVFEARQVRDAERDDPGGFRRALDARLAAGLEPTRAAEREAANVRLRAERRVGELLKELERADHDRSPGRLGKSASDAETRSAPSPYARALSDQGISRQSA